MFTLMLHYLFLTLCFGFLYFINAQMKDNECPDGWRLPHTLCTECARKLTETYTKQMCYEDGFSVMQDFSKETVYHTDVICCQGTVMAVRRPRSLLTQLVNQKASIQQRHFSKRAFGNPSMPKRPPKKKKKGPSLNLFSK